jgi:hypothetical protein
MRRFFLTLVAVTLAAPALRAHFIWIVPDKDGTTAHVVFSDSPKPDDPKLLPKIAKTEVYVRPADGPAALLKWTEGKDSFVLTPPGKGTRLVSAVCRYGVGPFGKKEGKTFLLNYYATGLVGAAAQDKLPDSFTTAWDKQPLQIVPAKQGERKFVVLWKGKPLPKVAVAVVQPDVEEPSERQTDENGTVQLPKEAGLYGLRVRHAVDEKGKLDGKEYEEIRNYATLVVQVGGALKARAAEEPKADPAATKLLADARAARATWRSFPGFTADIEVNFDGKVQRGSVRVDAAGDLRFERLPDEAAAWAKRNLGSIVNHRIDTGTPRDTPCAFADDVKDHPLGRSIRVLNDELHSGYRIKDNQIMVVNRQMKGSRFTITVLENRKNKEGKYLASTFVVDYWNLQSGELTRSEANLETWTRVGDFDLPVLSQVTKSSREKPKGEKKDPEDDGYTTKSLTLSNHKLFKLAK